MNSGTLRTTRSDPEALFLRGQAAVPTRTRSANSSSPPAASLVPAVTLDTLVGRGGGQGSWCAKLRILILDTLPCLIKIPPSQSPLIYVNITSVAHRDF